MKVRGYSFLEDTGANYGNAAELLESAGNKCKLAKSCEGPSDSGA